MADSPEAIQRRYAKRRADYAAAKKARLSQNFTIGTISKTSVAFRKMLPRAPDMTKSQLRDMLSQAVRNTPVSAE